MTGPSGAPTKRDERRNSRRGQYQQRQLERQRERQRKIQRQRITRIAITVGGIIIAALLLFVLIHAVTGGAGGKPASSKHAQYTTPALGETRENLSCLGANSPVEQHIHAYLAYYVNGKQVNITPDSGVLPSCVYPVHVHAQNPNILHVEAPNQDTYHLGDYFAVWGQHLSAAQVGANVADATHPLTFETIDQTGNVTKWPSGQDPWNIPLTAHETIFILYNSPDIKPTAYTQWGGL
jgi:hypothetical protein